MPKTKARRRFVHKPLLTDEERGIWRAFVTLNFAIARKLDEELRVTSALTLPEYEVLWELVNADENRLRMNELAKHLLFTRSGVTRLIDRLEAEGYVERDDCDHDGRGVFALLTEDGYTAFESAAVEYIASVRHYFFDRLRGDLPTMRRLLARIDTEDLL